MPPDAPARRCALWCVPLPTSRARICLLPASLAARYLDRRLPRYCRRSSPAAISRDCGRLSTTPLRPGSPPPTRCRSGASLWPRCAAGSNLIGSCGIEPLHVDFTGPLPHGIAVVPSLHPQQRVHVDTERLFDPQGHFRRERGVAVQQVGQRRAPHFEDFRCVSHRETELAENFLADEKRRGAAASWGFSAWGSSPAVAGNNVVVKPRRAVLP